MSAQNKVWAVSAGEYSGYGVLAFFAQEADAQAAVKAGYGEQVEEFDHYGPGEQPVHVSYYAVVATISAKTAEVITYGFDEQKWGWGPISDLAAHKIRHMSEWRHPANVIRRAETQIQEWAQGCENHRWEIIIRAVTEELARKVLYDVVAKTRAEILEGLR